MCCKQRGETPEERVNGLALGGGEERGGEGRVGWWLLKSSQADVAVQDRMTMLLLLMLLLLLSSVAEFRCGYFQEFLSFRGAKVSW